MRFSKLHVAELQIHVANVAMTLDDHQSQISIKRVGSDERLAHLQSTLLQLERALCVAGKIVSDCKILIRDSQRSTRPRVVRIQRRQSLFYLQRPLVVLNRALRVAHPLRQTTEINVNRGEIVTI